MGPATVLFLTLGDKGMGLPQGAVTGDRGCGIPKDRRIVDKDSGVIPMAGGQQEQNIFLFSTSLIGERIPASHPLCLSSRRTREQRGFLALRCRQIIHAREAIRSIFLPASHGSLAPPVVIISSWRFSTNSMHFEGSPKQDVLSHGNL